MLSINVKQIIPINCPFGYDECEGCPNFGSVENGIINCYADEGEKNNETENN